MKIDETSASASDLAIFFASSAFALQSKRIFFQKDG
jgi:hypothetical protein